MIEQVTCFIASYFPYDDVPFSFLAEAELHTKSSLLIFIEALCVSYTDLFELLSINAPIFCP